MATGTRKRRRGAAAPHPPADATFAHTAAVDPSAAAALPPNSNAPPPFSLKSTAALPIPPPPQQAAAANPPAAQQQQQQHQAHVDSAAVLLSAPAVAGPPPPSARVARPSLRFDAPFGLLDDDIEDGGHDSTALSQASDSDTGTRRVGSKRSQSPLSSAPTVRRSERQQRQQPQTSGKRLEAPPTPLSGDVIVPSSLPSSPASADSSAPTAINSPVGQAAGTVTGGRQLIEQLSLIMQRQQQPHEEDGSEAVADFAAGNGGTKKGRGRGTLSRSRRADTEEGDGQDGTQRQRRPAGRTAAGKKAKQMSGVYIDTTHAQDIRAFLPASHNLYTAAPISVQAPPVVAEKEAQQPSEEAAAECAPLSAPASPLTPPSRPMPAPPLSMLYPPSLIRSPHVDIAAIRKKFGLERSQESNDAFRTAAAVDSISPSQHDERKDSSMVDSSDSGRVETVRARTGKRKRGAETLEAAPSTTAAVSDSETITEEGMKREQLIAEPQSLRTTSIMPFSPSSPPLPNSAFVPMRSELSHNPTVSAESRHQLHPGTSICMEVDDTTSQQQLERASTIIVNSNTVDDMPHVRPTQLHPNLATAEPTPQPQSGDESILRQSSLTSTTSSTSTASADASTRLPSADRSTSSPPVVSPCERLPFTFPDYQCERLTARSGPFIVRCVAATTTGSMRQKNQDAYAVMASRAERTAAGDDSVCIFSVFDGHGALGHTASRLCAAIMPPQVAALIASAPAAIVDDAKDGVSRSAPSQRTEHRLSCLRRSFDVSQQLLLDVARAEQEYVATLLTKLQPDMSVTATRTCQSILPPRRPSPPSSPSMFIPHPPSLLKAADYDAYALLPPHDVTDLSIPSLVPLRRHGPESHYDDDVPGTRELLPLHTDEKQQPDSDNGMALSHSVEAAVVGGPVAERKKKKRRRRPLSKPRKRPSPVPTQPTQRQHDIRLDSINEQRALTDSEAPHHLHSDSESDGERENHAAHDYSLPEPSLLPIQRSPVKRVPVKSTTSKASPRLRAGELNDRSTDVTTPVAVDVDYGTTGLIVVVEGVDVYVANAGDSRCVLLEWEDGRGTITDDSEMTEAECKEQPAGLLSFQPRAARRARSPPSDVHSGAEWRRCCVSLLLVAFRLFLIIHSRHLLGWSI